MNNGVNWTPSLHLVYSSHRSMELEMCIRQDICDKSTQQEFLIFELNNSRALDLSKKLKASTVFVLSK